MTNRDKHRLILPMFTQQTFGRRTYHYSPGLPPDAGLPSIVRHEPDFTHLNPATDFWYGGDRRNIIFERIYLAIPNPEETEIQVEGVEPLDVLFGGPFGNLTLEEIEAILDCVRGVLVDIDGLF